MAAADECRGFIRSLLQAPFVSLQRILAAADGCQHVTELQMYVRAIPCELKRFVERIDRLGVASALAEKFREVEQGAMLCRRQLHDAPKIVLRYWEVLGICRYDRQQA